MYSSLLVQCQTTHSRLLARSARCLAAMFLILKTYILLLRIPGPVFKSSLVTSRFERVSAQIFIKTSGKWHYLRRATHIAETWGKSTDSITFMFDTSNKSGIDIFRRTFDYAFVNQVQGTDAQDGYKRKGGDTRKAFEAQRIKTRAVFDAFDHKYDWCCLFDDDMCVHHANLIRELSLVRGEDKVDHFIGDRSILLNTGYTMGGWCMHKSLVTRIQVLLNRTDQSIGWHGSDDMIFARVLDQHLHVTALDSTLWYSEHSKIIRFNNTIKKCSIWESGYNTVSGLSAKENRRELEIILPQLSVYHMSYTQHNSLCQHVLLT